MKQQARAHGARAGLRAVYVEAQSMRLIACVRGLIREIVFAVRVGLDSIVPRPGAPPTQPAFVPVRVFPRRHPR